jgi:hypothetical protein
MSDWAFGNLPQHSDLPFVAEDSPSPAGHLQPDSRGPLAHGTGTAGPRPGYSRDRRATARGLEALTRRRK